MSTANEVPLDPEQLSNDIQGLVEVAQLVNAARDAMSDEIVTRIASTLSESLMLLDRVTRNEGLMRLLQVLDHPDSQSWLTALGDSLNVATKEISTNAPARGGFLCLSRVVREPGTQEGLRFVAALGKHMSRSLREQHRHGGTS